MPLSNEVVNDNILEKIKNCFLREEPEVKKIIFALSNLIQSENLSEEEAIERLTKLRMILPEETLISKNKIRSALRKFKRKVAKIFGINPDEIDISEIIIQISKN